MNVQRMFDLILHLSNKDSWFLFPSMRKNKCYKEISHFILFYSISLLTDSMCRSSDRFWTIFGSLAVVLTYIGDIIAYRHGLHFCREVNPYRNQNKV